MQPIIIEDAITVGANATIENCIAANNSLKALQRLPFPAKITLAFTQSITGILLSFDIGSKNVVASSNGRVTATFPQTPLDIVNGNCYGEQGDLLILRAANTTAGAGVVRYRIMAEPLAEPGTIVQLPPNDVVMQQGPISIAAAAVDTQLLNGLRYERAPVDCTMDLLMTMSATGLLRQVYIDQDRVSPATTFSLANQIPQDPFDTSVVGIEVPEDKEIQLSVSNPTGGALNVFWKQILHPLYRK